MRGRIAEREETRCPCCRGGSPQGYQDCEYCDSSGRVCQCLECGYVLAAPWAEEHGQYCLPCKERLDMPESAEAAQ